MTPDRLTSLQREVLASLAPVRPPWTLTGGAALAGFHLHHRTTRDLDLFWHGRAELGDEVRICRDLLVAAGIEVEILQRSPSFVRMRASRRGEAVVVDLVAELVKNAYDPAIVAVPGGSIQVDCPAEILANKLGCLLHRAELRDLIDLRSLLATGLALAPALEVAASKDGGFSPLVLAHLLAGFPLQRQAAQLGLDATTTADLDRFRLELAARIAAEARP